MSSEWDRSRLVSFADSLIDAGRSHLSPHGSQINYPGHEGGYGSAVDGLEGFTRTLLIVGFRIAGERGQSVDELIDFAVRGITAGVDPSHEDRWVLLTEHAQAKVEAASIALILDLTRPWVWNRLDQLTQSRVIDYLAPVVGDETYPKTNWLWFRIVVQTFLRSVGGPWSPSDIAADLDLHDQLQRENGWISDGAERSFDHYVGWALHLYPILWSRMTGAAELAAGRTASDVARLDRYLQDAVHLIGADGSPLIQGRSLIYRFAAAAPFWAGVIAEVPSTPLGALRSAATRTVAHFADHGVPNSEGVLSLGWHGAWPALAQSYSGPGSPYWAAKGLLGVALPADHPVWAAQSEPLPIDSGDTMRVIAAPGWIVSSTRSDGIVRVVNHGTDHAFADVASADSPLYARLGYSTATSPLLDDDAWQSPLDQSVVLLDEAGRATHRSGMALGEVFTRDGVGVAGSRWHAHWLDATPTATRHGSGLPGALQPAGWVDTRSLVRGPWEVRLVRVESLESGANAVELRVGGWPVSGDNPATDVTSAGARASAGAVRSSVRPIRGESAVDVELRSDASPLGARSAVPVARFAPATAEWIAVLITLESADAPQQQDARIQVESTEDALVVDITWPDGRHTSTRLSQPRPALAAVRHQDRAQ